jgi:hypothetical protein
MTYSLFFKTKNLKSNFISIVFFLTQILIFSVSVAKGQNFSQSNSKSTTYHFQSETIWDKLNIIVEDFHGHFQIHCQSDNTVNGWMLTQGDDDEIVSSSDKSPGDNFQIEVSAPFTSCELTVLVNDDTQEIPMVISLTPEKERIWITPTPVPKPSESDIADLLVQAQKLEKVQKRLEALKLYLTVLKLDSANSIANKAVARIQDEVLAILIKRLEQNLKIHDSESAQLVLVQIRKLIPTDSRIIDWQRQINSFSQTHN